MNSKIITLIIGLSLISAFAWASLKPNSDTKNTMIGYHAVPSFSKTFYSTSSSSSSSGYSSSRSYSGGSYSYGK